MSTMRDTRRPLTARSVIASTLLGVDPPRLPARALVRSGELFGLREGATRTALSRMAAAGEVVAADDGYALVGPLLARHARQQIARRSSAVGRPWDGTWELVVVTADRRPAADRSAFRAAADRLRLAEVREGLWARPSSLDPQRQPDERAVIDDQATWVRGARPDDRDAFVAAFDLDGWAADARSLVAEMRAAQPLLDAGDIGALGDTFVTAAAVLRHLVADPMLPPELLDDRWPGGDLRSTFDRFDRSFKATWRSWHRQTFGPPPPEPAESETSVNPEIA